MKRAQLSESPEEAADASHFHMPASRHELIVVDEPRSSALLVKFGPGGRTHWHRHPDGQYLHVLEGEGRLQVRGGPVVSLKPGDTVYAPPGEEHWHGATAEGSIAHLAFSFGVTDWTGPVEDA